MAFNLEKGTKEPKKFNLAKSDDNTAAAVKVENKDDGNSVKKKNKSWLLALLLVPVIAGAWFFASGSKNATADDKASPATDKVAESSTATNANTPSSANTENANNASNSTNVEPNQAVVPGGSTENSAANANNSTPTVQNTSNPEAPTTTIVTFNTGSFESSIDAETLSKLKASLSKNASAKIKISGYASSEGDISFNQRLSEQRANAIKQQMIRSGIDASRISTEGKGTDKPIASNDTEGGRSKNRRAEIDFINN